MLWCRGRKLDLFSRRYFVDRSLRSLVSVTSLVFCGFSVFIFVVSLGRRIITCIGSWRSIDVY